MADADGLWSPGVGALENVRARWPGRELSWDPCAVGKIVVEEYGFVPGVRFAGGRFAVVVGGVWCGRPVVVRVDPDPLCGVVFAVSEMLAGVGVGPECFVSDPVVGFQVLGRVCPGVSALGCRPDPSVLGRVLGGLDGVGSGVGVGGVSLHDFLRARLTGAGSGGDVAVGSVRPGLFGVCGR